MKLALSWSSGKDCAWALQVLRQDPAVEVVALLTTFDEARDRVAMHQVRRELVRTQAQAARLPLVEQALPWPCSNADYEAAMRGALERVRGYGAEAMAFGDLFLPDVRDYRERKLAGTGLAPVFPLWKRQTRDLASEMVAGGLEAVITTLDPGKLPRELAGTRFDEGFLSALPEGVDPCGENGEFHSFACGGPMFDAPIAVAAGDVVEREGFVYADVIPVRAA